MATRFIGKILRKKVVRPLKNSAKIQTEKVVDDVVEEPKKTDESTVETQPKKENKKQKKNKDMVSENKLSQIEAIAGVNSSNVKVEKSEKGLYERTENSTILLTEDNKMLLND